MTLTSRALVVSACMLATIGYLARMSRAEPTPIREPLSALPYSIGGWTGMREPDLDEEVRAVLGADDYLLRSYRRGGAPPLGFYVGYYESQRQGDTIHSPMNCLPGSGWVPLSTGRRTLQVPDGAGARPIEVNRVVIQKGLDRQLVLYWYQGHGRVVASEYWGKVYTVLDAIRVNRTDAALVRIIVPIAGGGNADAVRNAEVEADRFAQAVFPLLTRVLPS
jgi:EpsI family protein